MGFVRTKTLLFILIIAFLSIISYSSCNQKTGSETIINTVSVTKVDSTWHAPDTTSLSNNPDVESIRYGKNIIANTSFYLGPKGTIAHVSNGMNCQNCHLLAGTFPFGYNFGAVASTYSKFRPRSGTIENIYERVNDCLQRSLNGKAIDTNGREMRAMAAYITWAGKDVPKGKIPYGTGSAELAFLDRAANPDSGEVIYIQKCQVCHGKNGDGQPDSDEGFTYPPLWGDKSYNSGASMQRLIILAAFVKYNMPLGSSWQNPQLTDDEAWDVSAYINSQSRPEFNKCKDWPDLSAKPIDYPFGPYSDGFTERQHKYGPYKPIVEARNQQNLKKRI
jgi:thiosulfate dehydrogenase